MQKDPILWSQTYVTSLSSKLDREYIHRPGFGWECQQYFKRTGTELSSPTKWHYLVRRFATDTKLCLQTSIDTKFCLYSKTYNKYKTVKNVYLLFFYIVLIHRHERHEPTIIPIPKTWQNLSLGERIRDVGAKEQARFELVPTSTYVISGPLPELLSLDVATFLQW